MVPKVRSVMVLKLPSNKSPYWYLRWWELSADGRNWKEKWKSTGKTVKKEAEQLRRILERELDDGPQSHSDLTWGDFADEFIEKHVSRKPRTTQVSYQQCLNAFTEIGRPKFLATVSHALLEDFATKRLKLGAAAATVNRDLRHVRAALRWAKRRGMVSDVPEFKGVFIREDRKKPTVIPEEHFQAMIRALKDPKTNLSRRPADWWRIFLYVAYYLGLRRGEIFGLQWDHVFLETNEVRIVAPSSKARKERVLPLAPEIGQMLRVWKESNPSTFRHSEVLSWPFDNYRSLYDDWHAIQTAAGIPEGNHYVPKNCRSTCASALIASNVPTVVVKDFLGHATVATTENYYINTKPAMRAVATARPILIDDTASSSQADQHPSSVTTK
ncbi:MAG: tyrosine-type recombinase/integrase [Planctomycetaceae bacterium]